MNINWKQVVKKFGIKPPFNNFTGEEIVHEIAHVYLCQGKKAFNGNIGSQKNVDKIIQSKYKKDSFWSDLHEIKTSAVTFLVLEKLGESDITNIFHDMRSNISLKWKDKTDDLYIRFMKFVMNKNTIHDANIILANISKASLDLKGGL